MRFAIAMSLAAEAYYQQRAERVGISPPDYLNGQPVALWQTGQVLKLYDRTSDTYHDMAATLGRVMSSSHPIVWQAGNGAEYSSTTESRIFNLDTDSLIQTRMNCGLRTGGFTSAHVEALTPADLPKSAARKVRNTLRLPETADLETELGALFAITAIIKSGSESRRSTLLTTVRCLYSARFDKYQIRHNAVPLVTDNVPPLLLSPDYTQPFYPHQAIGRLTGMRAVRGGRTPRAKKS